MTNTLKRFGNDRADEIDALMPLIRQAHADSPLAPYMLNETEIRNYMYGLAADSYRDAIFYIYDSELDEVVGFMAVERVTDPFVNYTYLKDYLVFVKPSHRKKGLFRRLAKEASDWGKQSLYPAQDFLGGIMSGSPEAVRAYKGAGFSKTPMTTMKKSLTGAKKK